MSDFVKQNSCDCNFTTKESWVILSPIEQSIKKKIESAGVPLKDWDISINYGIKTGFNDAFIISGEKREEILNNCKTKEERKKTDDLIRPILCGRDIKRYEYNFADLYLINTHNGVKEKNIPRIDIKDYPAIKKHLDEYWEKIEKRADQGDTPYNLRNCAYMDEFFQPHIGYCEIGIEMNACMIESGIFINNKIYMVTGKHLEFLIIFFNSKLFNKIILQSANVTGGKGVDFMNKIHCIIPNQQQIAEAKKLLKNNSTDYEKDEFINNIYNLTPLQKEYLQTI